MDNKKHLPITKKTGNLPVQDEVAGPENLAGTHIGSSDAFMKTEDTASGDADNVSDEKLDEMLDED